MLVFVLALFICLILSYVLEGICCSCVNCLSWPTCCTYLIAIVYLGALTALSPSVVLPCELVYTDPPLGGSSLS